MFHSFRRGSMPYIPIVTNVIGIGNLAVNIFSFFPDYALVYLPNIIIMLKMVGENTISEDLIEF